MSSEAVRELRRALTPDRLVDGLGLQKGARRHPRGFMVCCVWHQEKTPSLRLVTGDDGTSKAHCFGCQTSGDALHVVAQVHGLDIGHDFGRVLEAAERIVGGATLADRKPWKEPERIDAASYRALADHLVELCPLVDEPDVSRYVAGRAMTFAAVHAGCAGLPRADQQAALVQRLTATFETRTLVLAGLVRAADDGTPDLSRFAWPRHRLVIPWKSSDGGIQVLQRRRLDAGEPKYIFPAGLRPLSPFGVEQLRSADPARAIAYAEGAVDALALRLLDARHGLGIVPLGIPGVGSWRPDWARLARGREVRIALDADAAGDGAVKRITDDLLAAGATRVVRWRPPNRLKDWGEALVRAA